MMKPKLLSYLLLANLVFSLTSCGNIIAAQDAPTPSLPTEHAAVSVGIIALGHSGLTGESSNPDQPGQDARENSWATGTTTGLNSIYQRLIAVRPETEGHVANLARGGSRVTALARQAQAGLVAVPNPELVIIQTIDNDIKCDGSDPQNVEDFGVALAEVLQLIAATSPTIHILVVGQQGRPESDAAVIAMDPSVWKKFVGSGICDPFNNDGSLNEEHIATLTGIIESYEAEQGRVCDAVPQCTTDQGVLAGLTYDFDDWITGDWNHLNVQGQARKAETIWPVVSGLLGLK